ncbi:MAG: hypothetical protein CMD29_04845 [Flavobacteriales bacterium]|nr:hypothetical protein [Flavobacteriales bacterium]
MVRYLFLFFFFVSTISIAQEKKINLDEVSVYKKALPAISISGVKYSFRDRDKFVSYILKGAFWRDDFSFKISLQKFTHNEIFYYQMSGPTLIKIDNEILSKYHKYNSFKKIKKLNFKIKNISLKKFISLNVIAITTK